MENTMKPHGIDPLDPLIAYEYRAGHIYLNTTNRCTNACRFCSVGHNQGWLGPLNLNLSCSPRVPLRVHPENPLTPCPIPSTGTISPSDFLRMLTAEPHAEEILGAVDRLTALGAGKIHEVVWCGAGEPLIRIETVVEVSRKLKERGFMVRLNTNGQGDLIHGPGTVKRLAGAIDEVSVSLNAQDARTYARVSRPAAGTEAFDAVLAFTKRCVEILGKVTLSIVVPCPEESRAWGAAIDLEACRRIAEKLGARFRLR